MHSVGFMVFPGFRDLSGDVSHLTPPRPAVARGRCCRFKSNVPFNNPNVNYSVNLPFSKEAYFLFRRNVGQVVKSGCSAANLQRRNRCGLDPNYRVSSILIIRSRYLTHKPACVFCPCLHILLGVGKARPIARPLRKKERRPEVSMIAVPLQRLHETMPRYPRLVMTLRSYMSGARKP
jgi:hypothetical protein